MSDSDSSTNLAIELSRQEAIRHGKRRRVVVDDVDVPFSAVVRQADDGQPLLTEHLFSPNAIVQSFVQGDWEILPVQSASVQQPLLPIVPPEELVSSLLYDVRTQSRRTRTRVRSRSTARSSFEFRMNGSGIPADGVPHFLGLLDQCSLCSALKWAGETVSLCCMCGRVKLPPFAQHPEPLCSLFAGEHELSPHFLRHVRRYNTVFTMASFSAHIQRPRGGGPASFQICGVVHHHIGPLVPSAQGCMCVFPKFFVECSKFHVYFLGGSGSFV